MKSRWPIIILLACAILPLFLGACTDLQVDRVDVSIDSGVSQTENSNTEDVEEFTGSKGDESSTRPSSPLLTAYEIREMILIDACAVIDTRTVAEYTTGHVPVAVSIPMRFLVRRPAEIPAYKTLVIITSGEEENAKAKEILLSLGHSEENIFFLEGGFDSWVAAGYNVDVAYNMTGC
jgi:rhodanese-related sulfurtransferase